MYNYLCFNQTHVEQNNAKNVCPIFQTPFVNNFLTNNERRETLTSLEVAVIKINQKSFGAGCVG